MDWTDGERQVQGAFPYSEVNGDNCLMVDKSYHYIGRAMGTARVNRGLLGPYCSEFGEFDITIVKVIPMNDFRF